MSRQILHKVSIIMPCFNRADLILDSVQSILAQTYTNWELVIIDDGSTDDTKSIIASIKDERIHFFETPHSGIVGRLRNIGLQKASGEFIAFNDSDDLWHPSKLEKQIQALLNKPGVGFCLVNGYNFNETNKPEEYFYKAKSGRRSGDLFHPCFQSEVAGFTQALLFRKECLDKSGFFREDKKFSDFDYIISLAKQFEGIIIYEPLVFRRLHQQNGSEQNWETEFHHGESIIADHKSFLPEEIYNTAMFRFYINFGEACLKKNKKGKAISLFWKSWRHNRSSVIPAKKITKAIVSTVRGKGS